MDPKMVISAFEQIAKSYGELHARNSGCEELTTKLNAEIVRICKLLAERDKEIDGLKRQLEAELPRLAREIDGWKAKYAKAESEVATTAVDMAGLAAELTEVKKILNEETNRADALAQKYDPEIKAAAKAAAEAETKRQIAELEAKLKALKKE